MKSRTLIAETIRPSNTTAYAAGQVIANADGYPHMVIENVFRKQTAQGYATTGADYDVFLARVVDMTDNTAGSARHRLHFFMETSGKLEELEDGRPFPELYEELPNYMGSVDLPAPRTGGTGSDAVTREVKDLLHPIQAGPENSIIVVRVTLDATTPISNQKYLTAFTFIQE